MKILFVSLLNVMHFEIRTDRNTVCTDRYSASILDNPPVGGGGALKERVVRAVPPGP